MKLFEQIQQVERPEPQKAEVDSSEFVKRNLMKSVDRSPEIRDAVEKWLFSFKGGITKDAFMWQMKRLDYDDSIAFAQLERAVGRRTIPLPPPPKKPKLEKSLVEQMLEDNYVAVYGKAFRQAIKEANAELKECGQVYVLQVEDLILQFKSYEDKGAGPQMIDKAIECDFLIVVDLEMTIHLEWHIREALNRILRKRMADKKPIISTWNRFNDVNDFFEKFKIYRVE